MNEWDRLPCPCCSTWHDLAAARTILAEALDWNNTAVRLLCVAFGTGVKTPFLLCLSLLLENKYKNLGFFRIEKVGRVRGCEDGLVELD
ncbi:hypothetical protein KY289_002666 [Solanum tuberosum]|nr:hypothetical protein KY289_002666 [Solanum tuberosum]